MAMLKVENLSIKYGSIEAVKNVSFEVNEGEVVTLIGANGAGKTSILRTISGLLILALIQSSHYIVDTSLLNPPFLFITFISSRQRSIDLDSPS